jgi:hypothetical protein
MTAFSGIQLRRMTHNKLYPLRQPASASDLIRTYLEFIARWSVNINVLNRGWLAYDDAQFTF